MNWTFCITLESVHSYSLYVYASILKKNIPKFAKKNPSIFCFKQNRKEDDENKMPNLLNGMLSNRT